MCAVGSPPPLLPSIAKRNRNFCAPVCARTARTLAQTGYEAENMTLPSQEVQEVQKVKEAQEAKEAKEASSEADRVEDSICVHIFSVSAAMVGVCLTGISLIRVIVQGAMLKTIADDLLALDSVIFLVCCIVSYCALRSRQTRRVNLEHMADLLFLLGLVLMVIVSILFVRGLV